MVGDGAHHGGEMVGDEGGIMGDEGGMKGEGSWVMEGVVDDRPLIVGDGEGWWVMKGVVDDRPLMVGDREGIVGDGGGMVGELRGSG